MDIYQVGGAVRDKLLNRPVKDHDWVVVGASPEQLQQLGYTQVGRDFPVFLHPETKEEYALARTERKTGKGYTGFDVHASPDVTLEDDLQRRDLTINAIAQDHKGQLYDPFNGQADLALGLLRHISPAFVEDPVRILRVARFAARFGFTVAEETQHLMQTMVENGEVDALVPERVWQETQKALTEENPQRFFQVLRECGALARIFPAIDKLFGVPQPEKYHPEIDTGIHTLLSLQAARRLTNEPSVLFAAVTHDLGKGVTAPEILPHHYGHEGAGVPLIEKLCTQYHVPTDYRELAVLVARYHTHCHQVTALKAKTLLETLQALDAFRRPQRFKHFLLACEADAKGRTGMEDIAYPQAEIFQQAFIAAKNVSVQTIIAEGITGAAISEELKRRQLSAIRQWKKESATLTMEDN
ncbi:multifunctional CCA addition/repair protein [Beggiatoa leptomitoformis]|uniref:Multifunctional CCA protein n=1 Tax=Beggiatoa leptomitoformis TaxID=288004 RepID=A0A2N9YIY6_9GAMM|nr:multifunctional CCA addition/repair protein [Beggiatoa leptomitoformis]ALG67591.1 multifunctional CCA addition/repair protein [Beggiatoa leptomitoformis]AUI70176.1 multifunctional CCA addition/repair protein [Beggiatoa leptomitoformis]